MSLGQRITQSILEFIGYHSFELVLSLISYYFLNLAYKKYLRSNKIDGNYEITDRYSFMIMKRKYGEHRND